MIIFVLFISMIVIVFLFITSISRVVLLYLQICTARLKVVPNLLTKRALRPPIKRVEVKGWCRKVFKVQITRHQHFCWTQVQSLGWQVKICNLCLWCIAIIIIRFVCFYNLGLNINLVDKSWLFSFGIWVEFANALNSPIRCASGNVLRSNMSRGEYNG